MCVPLSSVVNKLMGFSIKLRKKNIFRLKINSIKLINSVKLSLSSTELSLNELLVECYFFLSVFVPTLLNYYLLYKSVHHKKESSIF